MCASITPSPFPVVVQWIDPGHLAELCDHWAREMIGRGRYSPVDHAAIADLVCTVEELDERIMKAQNGQVGELRAELQAAAQEALALMAESAKPTGEGGL
ncbi:MAG: hypothetical protein J5I90_06390 [Caldilineales bacterium]|nr:hypothetical protein [Caldilineales bacterium]